MTKPLHCAQRAANQNESHVGNTDIFLWIWFILVVLQLSSYLDLSFPHNLVHNLVVVLVEHAFVVTLLVTKDPQVLGALQLDFKLLLNDTAKGE